MCGALAGLALLTVLNAAAALNIARQNASSAEQHAPISKKLNLMILPLSAALFFIGLLVSRCYCWMVQDIREHDRNMDNVFSDHSLRREHQAVVEKVTNRRIHRLLKRGYSYSDELVNYMAQSFDPLPERNCASLGADFAQNDVKLVKWLDEMKPQLPNSAVARAYHFSLSYPASFASPRSPPPPLHTRSFPALGRIPEDVAVGIDKIEPLLPSTDSTSLTICSSGQQSSDGEAFSDPSEQDFGGGSSNACSTESRTA